jgi:DNA repair exonuclease SbcCD nuclease subunit
MERAKSNKIPALIACSDLHLREDQPICRTDNFWNTQWRKMDFIKNLQSQWNCPVICAGDVFHHYKTSPHLLTETMKHLPAKFFACAGQHDLPQHSLDLMYKSGFGTLREAEYIKTANDWDLDIDIHFCHFGQDPPINLDKRKKHILVWHHLTYTTKPFPGASGGMAEGILRKYNEFCTIFCGDNHQSFTVEYQGRRLVNPGSLTRQTADQADFKPRVYLWYAEDNSVQPVYLPIQEGVISREHIEHKEERDKRIDAFVSKLDGEWEAGMSFEQNLEEFFNTNNTREPVKSIIYKSIE